MATTTRRRSTSSQAKTEVPAPDREVASTAVASDHSFTLQCVMQMHKELGTLTEAVKNLQSETAKTTAKVEGLENKATSLTSWAKGLGLGLTAVGLVIVGVIGLFWWIFGGQIESMRDRLFELERPASRAEAPRATE